MNRSHVVVAAVLIGTLLLGNASPTVAQTAPGLSACTDFAYSTEEDFVANGPVPADGNPIISDGDLLSRSGSVCARNSQLLSFWDMKQDMGLDAVDIIDVDSALVAFSTELDDSRGRFKAGDLLATNGTVIPNIALLKLFQVSHDMGLDGLHFVGEAKNLGAFFATAAQYQRSDWLENVNLIDFLNRYQIDIWFSVESTERTAAVVQILDGDLLSARTGVRVLGQEQILPLAVPAGIPTATIQGRGVDFGLDAITASRSRERTLARFSTEILYRGEIGFTDGDILRAVTGAVEIPHPDLVNPFEPAEKFLGVDALYMRIQRPDPAYDYDLWLPFIAAPERATMGGGS